MIRQFIVSASAMSIRGWVPTSEDFLIAVREQQRIATERHAAYLAELEDQKRQRKAAWRT